MKQIVLSIEQMKHLASLGLDTTDASMYYSYEGVLQTCKSYEPTQKNSPKDCGHPLIHCKTYWRNCQHTRHFQKVINLILVGIV